jgi:argininosuccinate lyase
VRFDPEYVSQVLNENFEDAKTLFLSPLLAIHYAHLVMLADRGIVTAADARSVREALDGISVEAIKCTPYDGTCEDLFFYIERHPGSCVRRRRCRPSAHRAQPQRHRHDDVPDAAA